MLEPGLVHRRSASAVSNYSQPEAEHRDRCIWLLELNFNLTIPTPPLLYKSGGGVVQL